MLSFPNENRSNTYGQVTLPNQCQCQHWPSKMLPPGTVEEPGRCWGSENEIELGLLTSDIPVFCDQPLALETNILQLLPST